MESDVDVDMGTGGHRADDLWAGGLRGGGDAGLGRNRLRAGK